MTSRVCEQSAEESVGDKWLLRGQRLDIKLDLDTDVHSIHLCRGDVGYLR